MAKGAHFNLGFTGISIADLNNRSNTILVNMEDNDNYTDVGERLTNAQEAKGEWLRIKGLRGAMKNYKSAFAKAKTNMIEKLVTMGEYARDKYPGNVEKWETSGYVIQFYDSDETVPRITKALKAADGTDIGDVTVTYRKAENAEFYEMQIWLKGTTMPTDVQATAKGLKMRLTGKTPGVIYMIRIRTVGTKGRKSGWTVAIPFILRLDPNG